MNIWHNINPKRITAQEFDVVIEIPMGSKTKYELDKETGFLKLDRILHTSMHYPANYGFIPKTYGNDKDPLDVLVLCTEAINPLTIVKCHPIGVINMIDSGKKDEKIIAVHNGDPTYSHYEDICEIPKHISLEMKHFFQEYKKLENDKSTFIESISGKNKAISVIKKSIENYKIEFESN